MKEEKVSFIQYYNKEGRFFDVEVFMPQVANREYRTFDDLAIVLTNVGTEDIQLFGKLHTLDFKSRCDKWTKNWKKLINDNAKQYFKKNFNANEIIRRGRKPPVFIHLYDDLRFLNLMMQRYKVPKWINDFYPNESRVLKHPYMDECGERIMFLKLKKDY